MIKKVGSKYVLFSKDGDKKLGEFESRKEAEKREKEINAIKHANKAALVEVDLVITKANVGEDGQPRWLAVASDTGEDRTTEATTLTLFEDWIDRIEKGLTESWLPPPRKPFLGVSHYPSLDGYGEAGESDRLYIDGQQFKGAGIFFSGEAHPLGPILFKSVAAERELIKKGEAIERPIRISAAWWDIQHRHGDFIFTRRSLDHKCSICEKGANDKVYLKGQLDHFAATRVPINPRTSLGLEEKSMPIKRKDDAASIVGEKEAEELEKRTKKLTGKSETELPEALAVKASTVGDYIKSKREDMGKTRADVMDDEEELAAIESGEKKPSKSALSTIAKALEVDEKELENLMEEKAEIAQPVKADTPSDEEDDEEEKDKKKKGKKKAPMPEKAHVLDLSALTEADRQKALTALSEAGIMLDAPAQVEQMYVEPEMMYRPFGGATSIEEAEAFMESEDLMWQAMDHWGLLNGVMENILNLEPEEDELESNLNQRKITAMQEAFSEFGDRISALKAGLPDAYLLQPIVKSEPVPAQEAEIMTDQITQQPQAQPVVPAQPQPGDAYAALKANVATIMANTQLDRQAKEQALQQELAGLVGVLRGQLDAVNPPDMTQLVNEAVQKSVGPLAEKMDLIFAKLGQGQPAPGQPVQKSHSNLQTFGDGPQPAQKSSIRDIARRSVGLQS